MGIAKRSFPLPEPRPPEKNFLRNSLKLKLALGAGLVLNAALAFVFATREDAATPFAGDGVTKRWQDSPQAPVHAGGKRSRISGGEPQPVPPAKVPESWAKIPGVYVSGIHPNELEVDPFNKKVSEPLRNALALTDEEATAVLRSTESYLGKMQEVEALLVERKESPQRGVYYEIPAYAEDMESFAQAMRAELVAALGPQRGDLAVNLIIRQPLFCSGNGTQVLSLSRPSGKSPLYPVWESSSSPGRMDSDTVGEFIMNRFDGIVDFKNLQTDVAKSQP